MPMLVPAAMSWPTRSGGMPLFHTQLASRPSIAGGGTRLSDACAFADGIRAMTLFLSAGFGQIYARPSAARTEAAISIKLWAVDRDLREGSGGIVFVVSDRVSKVFP